MQKGQRPYELEDRWVILRSVFPCARNHSHGPSHRDILGPDMLQPGSSKNPIELAGRPGTWVIKPRLLHIAAYSVNVDIAKFLARRDAQDSHKLKSKSKPPYEHIAMNRMVNFCWFLCFGCKTQGFPSLTKTTIPQYLRWLTSIVFHFSWHLVVSHPKFGLSRVSFKLGIILDLHLLLFNVVSWWLTSQHIPQPSVNQHGHREVWGAVLWLCCFDLLPWAPRIVGAPRLHGEYRRLVFCASNITGKWLRHNEFMISA